MKRADRSLKASRSNSNYVIYDYLALRFHPDIKRMLASYGDNLPMPEKVFLSMKLTKINRRGKSQERLLLLTDKALYNIKPRSMRKCRRRIDMRKVESVSRNADNNEFAVHVSAEYDYHFKTNKMDDALSAMQEVYKRLTGRPLSIRNSGTKALNNFVITRPASGCLSTDEKLRRWTVLLDENERPADSDEKGPPSKISAEDFENLNVIGRGAFGKVLRVRKKSNGQIYAMKILKKSHIIESAQVRNTKAERVILRKTEHPFLMHLRYAFQSESKLYLVMDYYVGGELFFHLQRRRRFREVEARFIVAEISLALAHLHGMDIVYRDMKPENILLDEKGHACLTDFGLVKQLTREDGFLTKTFCGTPSYLAPEVVEGVPYGKDVDWWSLGVLTYELCVGGPPFYDENVHHMLRLIMKGDLILPSHMSRRCKSFIVGLLRHDSSKRLGRFGVRDIKNHPFMMDVHWERLLKKELVPPFQPKVTEQNDVANVDREFLAEPVVDSFAAPPRLGTGLQEDFQGFTYQPETNLDT